MIWPRQEIEVHRFDKSRSGLRDRPRLSRQSAKQLLAKLHEHNDDEPNDSNWPAFVGYIVLGQSQTQEDHDTYIVIRHGSDRPLELRLLRRELVDALQLATTLEELKKLLGLQLPFLPAVVDVGAYMNRPFIVTILNEVTRIDRHFRNGTRDIREVVAMLIEIFTSVHRLHQVAGPHGNLNPFNVLIDGSRKCQIAGFGIASIVAQLDVESHEREPCIGESPFRSPQQIQNLHHSPSIADDVFSLGKIAESVLKCIDPAGTRRSGLLRSFSFSSMWRWRGRTILRPLVKCIAKATFSTDSERYRTVQDMTDAFSRWLNEQDLRRH